MVANISPRTVMRKSLQSSNLLRVGSCAALVALCTLGIFGQSGRRVRKSTPAPVSTPEPTPSPAKPEEKQKPAFTFIIGTDKYGDFSRIPLHVSSGVLRACANRLDDPEPVKVEVAPRDLGRADAVLRAKAEKEAFVVWLQLRPNSFSGTTEGTDDLNNVYIEYSVFAPATGKQVTSGRTFPRSNRKGGVIVQRPGSSNVYGEYYLNEAAKEAAERILAHFHIGVQNRRP